MFKLPRFLLTSLFGLTAALFLSESVSAADFRAALAAQNSVTPGLMRTPGILGTAVGVTADGQSSVVIYVDQNSKQAAGLVAKLNRPVAGIPVQVELTDQFKAYGKPGGTPGPGGVSHTAAQTAPIQLGTSGGFGYDLANGYCCGGTLGSLVKVGDVKYILSNYHVFESDIVLGGNNRVAANGDPVIQPGLIDVNCNVANAQSVGTLVITHSLPNSNVDVGLALAGPGISADGAILEIGTISSQTVAASVGQGVKKSGRTSGLTRSSVAQLNATISVIYDNECAGGTAFTATFRGQIVINNRAGKFLISGDSGSLLVEDVTTNPKAVGLLYAGSSQYAIANPIDEVLAFVGTTVGGTASMVGN